MFEHSEARPSDDVDSATRSDICAETYRSLNRMSTSSGSYNILPRSTDITGDHPSFTGNAPKYSITRLFPATSLSGIPSKWQHPIDSMIYDLYHSDIDESLQIMPCSHIISLFQETALFPQRAEVATAAAAVVPAAVHSHYPLLAAMASVWCRASVCFPMPVGSTA